MPLWKSSAKTKLTEKATNLIGSRSALPRRSLWRTDATPAPTAAQRSDRDASACSPGYRFADRFGVSGIILLV
jgi:hypothetical protein